MSNFNFDGGHGPPIPPTNAHEHGALSLGRTERAKRLNVLHCIISNLKNMRKILMLTPGKISADAHVS